MKSSAKGPGIESLWRNYKMYNVFFGNLDLVWSKNISVGEPTLKKVCYYVGLLSLVHKTAISCATNSLWINMIMCEKGL